MGKLLVESTYGVTPTEVLNHLNLSLKAKGLFGFIQSKPNGWSFSALKISKQSLDGRDSVMKGLQELEKCGYLKRYKKQTSNGKWDWDYVLAEKPLTDYPSTVKPSTAKPSTEKPSIYSKIEVVNERSKNIVVTGEQSSTDETPVDKPKYTPLGAELIKAFEAVDVKNKLYYRNTNQRSAADFIIAEYGFEEACKRISFLPVSNKMVYFPNITSPCQLRDNWVKLSDAVDRYRLQHANKSAKNKIAFT